MIRRAATALLIVWAVGATVVAWQRGHSDEPAVPTREAPAACPKCEAEPEAVRSRAAEFRAQVPPFDLAAICQCPKVTGICECPAIPSEHQAQDPKELEAGRKCEAGDLRSCTMAAMMARKSPVRSAQYSARACNLGSMRDCEVLGYSMTQGDGVQEDREKGLALLRMACDAGSCFHLGLAQRRTDEAEASAAYTSCCLQRNGLCCDALGDIFSDREGPPDFATAAGWYEAGCELGNKGSCKGLVRMAEKGQLGVVTPEKFAALLKRACAVGDLKSCDKLAPR